MLHYHTDKHTPMLPLHRHCVPQTLSCFPRKLLTCHSSASLQPTSSSVLALSHHYTEPLHPSLCDSKAPRYLSSLMHTQEISQLAERLLPFGPKPSWRGSVPVQTCQPVQTVARHSRAAAHPAANPAAPSAASLYVLQQRHR